MKLSHPKIAARSALLLAGACFHWGALAAESIGAGGAWRCGNTYTDQPCAGGKELDLDDTRNSEQKRVADQSTRDAQIAADRMKSDRLRLEDKHAQQRPILIGDKPKEARKTQTRPDKAASKKPKKGQKDTVYVSAQTARAAEAAPPKKSKKSGARKPNE